MDYETGEPTEGQKNEQNIWEQAMAEPVIPEAVEEHEDLSEQEILADAAVDVAESLLADFITLQNNSDGRIKKPFSFTRFSLSYSASLSFNLA